MLYTLKWCLLFFGITIVLSGCGAGNVNVSRENEQDLNDAAFKEEKVIEQQVASDGQTILVSEKYGFRIPIPKDWQIFLDEDPKSPELITAYPPEPASKEAHFIVFVYENEQKLSLADWLEVNIPLGFYEETVTIDDKNLELYQANSEVTTFLSYFIPLKEYVLELQCNMSGTMSCVSLVEGTTFVE